MRRRLVPLGEKPRQIRDFYSLRAIATGAQACNKLDTMVLSMRAPKLRPSLGRATTRAVPVLKASPAACKLGSKAGFAQAVVGSTSPVASSRAGNAGRASTVKVAAQASAAAPAPAFKWGANMKVRERYMDTPGVGTAQRDGAGTVPAGVQGLDGANILVSYQAFAH